jgi:hypothetical protein
MRLLPMDGPSRRSRRTAVLTLSAAALIVAAALPSFASAQATRTWVSGVGDDVNPCSRTAPCKTFAGAISKTAAKGEINVLDPGGFGAVTITKAITIQARGNTAGVLTNAANAINVSAGVNDRVTLDGLDINGLDTAASGVKINSGKVVRIMNSEIYGFATAGVSFTPSTANARLVISKTSIYDNTAGNGVNVQPTAAGGKVTIKNSDIDDNANGVIANSSGTQAVSIGILRTTINSNSGNGLLAFTNSTFRVGDSTITDNLQGLNHPSGAILSWGNNLVAGNDTDGTMTGSITPLR